MFVRSLFLIIVVFLLDVISKRVVFDILASHNGFIEVLPFFNLVTVYNYGVSFGMFNDLANGHIILSILTAFILLLLFFWLKTVKKPLLSYALAMVIGGALGNLSDRITYGAVADFLDFHVMGYHWPAFNIADSCIFIGVVLIIFDSFMHKDLESGDE